MKMKMEMKMNIEVKRILAKTLFNDSKVKSTKLDKIRRRVEEESSLGDEEVSELDVAFSDDGGSDIFDDPVLNDEGYDFALNDEGYDIALNEEGDSESEVSDGGEGELDVDRLLKEWSESRPDDEMTRQVSDIIVNAKVRVNENNISQVPESSSEESDEQSWDGDGAEPDEETAELAGHLEDMKRQLQEWNKPRPDSERTKLVSGSIINTEQRVNNVNIYQHTDSAEEESDERSWDSDDVEPVDETAEYAGHLEEMRRQQVNDPDGYRYKRYLVKRIRRGLVDLGNGKNRVSIYERKDNNNISYSYGTDLAAGVEYLKSVGASHPSQPSQPQPQFSRYSAPSSSATVTQVAHQQQPRPKTKMSTTMGCASCNFISNSNVVADRGSSKSNLSKSNNNTDSKLNVDAKCKCKSESKIENKNRDKINDGFKNKNKNSNSKNKNECNTQSDNSYNYNNNYSSGCDSMNETLYSHEKINIRNLSYLVCNVRGFNSKKLSIEEILKSSDFDVVLMSETHLYKNKSPRIPGYSFIGRSREKVNSKGGVAVGIKKELEPYAVKVFEGTGCNETILIKLTCFSPAVVVGVYYGNQENTTPNNIIENNLTELFTQINAFKDEGCNVLIGGDLNVHVGESIKGNDPAVSKGGKLLLSLCEQLGFDIVNNLGEGCSHTHYDLSSGTSRVLDMVITDDLELQERFEVDNEKQLTPYRIKMRGEQAERMFTDHLSVFGEMKVGSSVKPPQKIKMWRMSRPGGRLMYQNLTDQMADLAVEIINNSMTSDEMMKRINDLLHKIKLEAFGVRTVTHKRKEREDDIRLLTRRMKELERANKEMDAERKKLHERVFITRKKAETNSDEILEAIDHYKTGERLNSVEEIADSVMDYNVEVLKKNEPRTEEAAEIRNFKREAVEFFQKVETRESERDITWDEYMLVVEKVQLVNKTCYRDFLWAGPKWQAVMFLLFRRIYRTEDIPEEFLQTKLKKLYKKKGDKAKLTSYRFIHLKDWAGKMMEKLAMQKVKDKLAAAMPDLQIGGMEKSQTQEHIASIHALARMKRKEKGGVIIQFIDCMKCFDKQLLDDTLYSAVTAGASGKELRVMKQLHDNTVIKLVGDPTNREEVVTNSTGQGTNWAPLSCSLSMGQTIKKESEVFRDSNIKVGDLPIDPLMFVDDATKISDNTESARQGGTIFTRALDELGLHAHPEKSAQVIIGSKKFKERVRKELAEKPVKIQGWELKESECETYLGVEISTDGIRDSITKSIEKRCKAAVAKEVQISKVLEEDMMEKVGWIESVKTLFNSIIISTLTYGTAAFTGMTKKNYDQLESTMKNILFRMLKLSKFAHYATVLYECNMIRIKHIINQLKIGFVRNILQEKAHGYCYEIMLREELLYPGTGIIAEVRNLCQVYGIPDVTKYAVEKDLVKERIWDFGRREVWKEALKNKRVPISFSHLKQGRPYMLLPKYESRLYFAYRIGELQFKENRRGEYKKRFGNTNCFADGCSQPDTLEHALACKGYMTKWNKDPSWIFWEDLDNIKIFVEYLKKLDGERARFFYLPLLYRPGLKEVVGKQ